MKSKPRIGAVGTIRFQVAPGHAIDFADTVMPAVLASPWLIWFLEHAAREAVLPHLDSGESTVGTDIEIVHLAPTPVGQWVTCTARIVQVEGARISFQFDAHDECEAVAKGFHKLQIIRAERFAARVGRKFKPGN
jgi:fluoroacetyl-CoA thioesterase